MTQKEHKNHPNNIHNVVGKDRRVAKKNQGICDRQTDRFWSWKLLFVDQNGKCDTGDGRH